MSVDRSEAPGGAVVRVERRAGRLVDSPWTIPVAAAAAFLLRLPGLTRPIRADEAGFVLVARAWAPQPDTMYGAYFVDRPPLVIAVFKAVDAVGGPLSIRVLGALTAAALVLLAAAAARVVADGWTARWVAVLTAALVITPAIDAVAAKGELLALPLLMGAVLSAMVATRDRAWPPAFLAGLLAALALGLKQNLAGAAVFTAVLLLASWWSGRLGRRDLVRLSAAAATGFALPVAATVGWALLAGVRLRTLWDTVYGFRADAARALTEEDSIASAERAGQLVLIAVVTGIAIIITLFVAHSRTHWRTDGPLVAATAAMLGFDLVSLVLGGSFWRAYLFPLVPGVVLAVTLLLRREGRQRTVAARLVLASVLSAVVCLAGWAWWNATGHQEFDEADTGTALHRVAEPGDTLVVFGGRPDLQLESGMASPYPYLWSLPMRARDPDLAQLRALVTGPEAPIWLVEWWPFDTWSEEGATLEGEVRDRYVEHGVGCGGRPIWLLRGVERAAPEPDCH